MLIYIHKDIQCLHKTRASLHGNIFIPGVCLSVLEVLRCTPSVSVVFRKWLSGKVTKSRPYFFLRCLLISFLFLSKVSLVNPDDLQNCPLVIISPIWTVFVPRALNGWAMFTMCSWTGLNTYVISTNTQKKKNCTRFEVNTRFQHFLMGVVCIFIFI